jgi:hypothetical protein
MSSEINEEYLGEEYYPDGWYVDGESTPVPDWHLAILEERMARHESEDKTKWTTLEEFEKEIEEFRQSLRSNKD